MTTASKTQSVKPKRRWRQFGLRFLWLVLTSVAVVLGMVSQPIAVSRKEANITRRIQDLGGGVTGYTYHDAWLRRCIPPLIDDKIYRRVSEIRLGFQLPSQELLQDLSTLTNVRRLSFTTATDDSIKSLPSISTLETLDLAETGVTDDCIDAIARHPNLKRLNCYGTKITYEGLKRLAERIPLEFSFPAQHTTHELVRSTEVILTIRDAAGNEEETRGLPGPYDKVVGITFPSMSSIEMIEKIRFFKHVESLTVTSFVGTPPRKLYLELAKLSNLKRLGVTIQGDIMANPMAAFAGLRNFRTPAVREAMRQAKAHIEAQNESNADNLDPLGRLTQLEELSLDHGYETSFAFLAKLTNLRTLKIRNASLEALGHLSELTKLTDLTAHVIAPATEPEATATELVAKVTSLESLNLSMRSLIDDDLRALANMPNLKSLAIHNAQIKGSGITYLANITTLEKVDISSLDERYLKQLQKQLRGAEVVEYKQYRPRKSIPMNTFRNIASSDEAHQRKKIAEGDFEIGKEWVRQSKLAAALRAQSNWKGAAQTFETAINQLIEGIQLDQSRGVDGYELVEAKRAVAQRSYAKALVEYDGMNAFEESIRTLERALSQSQSQVALPTAELARIALQTENPKSDHDELLWHSSANVRMLAFLHQADHPAEAFRYWTRYRLIQMAYGVGRYRIDPAELARIRARATSQGSTGQDISLFLEASDKPKQYDADDRMLASWQVHANEQPYLAIVPPAGKRIDTLAIRLPTADVQVECWCGGSNSSSPGRVDLQTQPSPKSAKTVTVDVPFDMDVIFARISPPVASEETILLQAKLRDPGSGASLPWATKASEPLEPSQRFSYPPFSFTPCWILDEEGNRDRGFSAHANEFGTSLCRLPDGRLLLAFTSDDVGVPFIKFSTSDDGVHWSEPWRFAYNRSRTTNAPKTLVDSDGTIWMVFNSLHSPGSRKMVWCTSTKDGREWTEPVLLHWSRFDCPVMDFMQCPDGDFLIVCRDGIGRGESPDAIFEYEHFELPVRTIKSISGYARFAFDDLGHCHVVAPIGRDGEIAYSTSKDMEIWSPVKIAAVSSNRGSYGNPRLLFDGDRAALIYRNDDRATVKHATLTENGLDFGQAIVSDAGWSDPRMLYERGRWLSIADAPNRKLKELTTSTLFSDSF